ncbi:Putative serpin-Z8 [Triticum urartu]|uniref:Putative serpin-Z8 n=1 Tax=Triticum urartu TaxID=4572 RepID=M8A521_TRIUA|nr:Putative serpin-Z8 [Triticum urartu]
MADIPLRDTVPLEAIQLDSDLMYKEKPVKILEFASRVTRSKILGVRGAPSRAALDEFLSGVAEDALEDHSESGGPRVAFACGVWTDLTCPLKPAYRHAAASAYKADANTVDFRDNPEAARGQINAWVAQATGNLIGSVLGPGSITPYTRVVLGNAIYFKGEWEDPFYKEATANKLFHRLDGRTVDVPFMQRWSSQFIAVHKGFKVLKLRHLPKRKIEVRELRVPKFKLSFHSSVVAILKKLELQLPFSDQADLSDMVERDGSDLPLVLSDVIHKAVIEVNEEGTVAAAVSMMHSELAPKAATIWYGARCWGLLTSVRDELKTLRRPAPSGWAAMPKSATLGSGTSRSHRRFDAAEGPRAPETAARGR